MIDREITEALYPPLNRHFLDFVGVHNSICRKLGHADPSWPLEYRIERQCRFRGAFRGRPMYE